MLLEQIEQAIGVFSDLVNAVEERQESSEDENLTTLCGRVPEALAGLAAAANDLRARLFFDDDEIELRVASPQKAPPAPLGFTINLKEEGEDPDEASESEI